MPASAPIDDRNQRVDGLSLRGVYGIAREDGRERPDASRAMAKPILLGLELEDCAQELLDRRQGCLVCGGVVGDLRPALDARIIEAIGHAGLCVQDLAIVA